MDGHVLPEKRPAMELWGCKAHRRFGLLYKLSLGFRCLSNVTGDSQVLTTTISYNRFQIDNRTQ